ncbi:MAG: hypothetical protein ACXVIP_05815 [Halobacteriota archaeon]
MQFARDAGAVDDERVKEHNARCKEILTGIACEQIDYIRSEEATQQFIILLRAAIAGGYGHVFDVKTNSAPLAPHEPSTLGRIEGRVDID